MPGGQVTGWPWTRHVISKGGSVYARLVLGMPIKDCTSGFKCLRASALRRLDLSSFRSKGYGLNVELNHACIKGGFRYAEVPIVFPDRTRGASKMTLAIVIEAALLVLRLRFTKTALVKPDASTGESATAETGDSGGSARRTAR